ncbi:MAG: 4Fe-4S dicluster domain-containing protein [Oligoflexia bacterium]|nr:4Fe-4S dicluster domain-containing protein [Oligoflexia bacterium]
MPAHFIHETDFREFLKSLIASKPVIGPVVEPKSTGDKFIFDDVTSAEQLRLDYDVSLVPPKAVFFPPVQKLLEFGPNGVKSCINPREQVLLGVHFYDVKAFDQLDKLFNDKFPDNNYLANRRATTVIASSVQTVSKHAFWGSFGKDVKAKGHDGFLTKVQGGYVYETFSQKGEALLKHGKFGNASTDQVSAAKRENDAAMDKCQEKVTFTPAEISTKTRASFSNNEMWKELSKDCFSCGSCNIVCPTCYCFDVQDKWGLDQVSGERYRTWDACLTEDFAKVSLGGAGGHENFREAGAQRFRHRAMRKLTYLNEKLGGPACIGCGRCTSACVPNIANPVKIINRIMKG